MALDKSDVLGSIFTGWWEADKADTAQRLKTRGEELKNKQAIVKQMKTADYNKEIAKYDADKKVIDGLNSVAANKSMYKDDIQLGEAVLMAKHGEKFADFKKNLTGAEGDLTSYYNFAKSEGQSFNIGGTEGTQISKNFKDKSVVDAEYTAAIAEIEKDTKEAIDAAAGDSKTINAILKLKNRLVNNISTDTKNVKTIDSVNETIKATGSNETETLKKIESNIKTDSNTEEVTDGSTEEVSTLKSADIPLFIGKTYRDDFDKKITKAKTINYSDKEYGKFLSDTVLSVIPGSKMKDFFNVDKDKNLIAKESMINADITIQSLLTNSLNDITVEDTFATTGNKKSKIDFNTNKRFLTAKKYLSEYGNWAVEGAVIGKDGDLKNLLKDRSATLLVPSNSIINIDSNKLKGFNIVINKEYRQDVGKVYSNFVSKKAAERKKEQGGSDAENIYAIQRALEMDTSGNEKLTQDARIFIALALKDVTNSEGKLVYPSLTKKKETTSSNETSSSNKKSTMDIKQEELGSGDDKEDFGSARIITIKDKVSGEPTKVPLTTKNKIWLTKNYPEVNLAVDQDTMTGDGSVMEQVASQTENKKITPQDVGVNESSNFFTKKADILAILPNDMSGQEIMDRYNLDMLPGQTFNKFTIYKPNK